MPPSLKTRLVKSVISYFKRILIRISSLQLKENNSVDLE